MTGFNCLPLEGTGSGCVLDTDGNILTNYHVIESADRLEVTLPDQSKYHAKVVGFDKPNDLAVIRWKVPRKISCTHRLGDSNALNIGQRFWPSAIPWPSEHTYHSIVSSLEGE